MLNLTGYHETETLYTGARTLVYRATRLRDDQPVIIKVLRTPHPHFNELVQFRNQYIITQNLDSSYIVQPLALERYGNGYALVMPDQGAVSLASYWQASDHGLHQLLTLAIQLAEALHILAGQQIIHKDIKPTNILIHPETGQVQLIDFSIASLLPKEQRQLLNPQGLEGTLAYISPEQTGRMNRGIDYRSDFYALGVTLYELLIGTLPFVTQDSLELLHAHIAQEPMPPSGLLNAQAQPYPLTVSNIILKLMAKNAEDRYQSALGLKHDLERCLQAWEETGAIADFVLGEQDICDRFNIPEKLYGREVEVQTLLAAFDCVAHGSSEMMLVAGFSGIGKTAVVNEVHKPIVAKRGYFVKGKYDQFNRNIPFSAVVQACRSLMGQILSESDSELTNWKSKILAALGANAQVLIEVIPELERVIGPQPQAAELSGTAAQNRFNRLFEKFISVFTTPEHPLVMFLDDLQWADSASLNLINVLMQDRQTGYLLLLGAYRDNEVPPGHPLLLTLAELAHESAKISTLTLTPLPEPEVNRLVAETLSCSNEIAKPLTELIYRKTRGNPFFTTQFLKGLNEEKLIVFDRNRGYWSCDLARVKDAALTDDVVEFMAARLKRFSETTQETLKLAACLGNQFTLETLAIVCEVTAADVASRLWTALQEGLILPISETYKFFQGDADQDLVEVATVHYRFLHDRVQQAAYTLIPERDKAVYHLKIGQSLLNHLSPQDVQEQALEIVGHFNLSHALLTDPAQILQVIQLNLVAGEKAQKSTAYAAAVDYFKQGIYLLETTAWHQQRDLTFTLHNRMAEAMFLAGEFAPSLATVSLIKQQANNILESITAWEVEIQVAQAQYQQLHCLDIALDVLQQLGVELPAHPTEAEIQQGMAEINGHLETLAIADIGDLPAMENPEIEAATRILGAIISAAYQVRPSLFQAIAIRQLQLTMDYGITAQTPVACVLYGMILTGSWLDVEQGYQFGSLGIELLERPGMEAVKSTTEHLFHNHIRSIKDPARASLKPSRECAIAGIEAGEYQYSSYSLLVHCQTAYFAGVELDRLAANMDIYIKILQRAKQEIAVSSCRIPQQAIANLRGSTAKIELVGAFYDETTSLPEFYEKEDGTNIAYIYVHKLALACLFEFEDISPSLEWIEAAETFIGNLSGMTSLPAFYFYNCLLRLRGLAVQAEEQQKINLDRFQDSLSRLRKFATHAPTNHQHKQVLVEAEYHRYLGENLTAMEMYDRAIAGAKANQYLQEEALANELAAQFYLDWDKVKIASTYLQEAYYCYARWGAKAKTDHLEAHYPQLLTPILQQQRVEGNTLESLTSLTQTLTTTLQSQTQSSTSISDTLDFAAILQAAQKLSSTIELDQLLGEITEIILTSAGAQKIVLLTPEQQQWQLQACAESVDESQIITQIQAQPLTADSPVPIRLIQYVKNTQDTVLISEVKTEITGILEGYLLKHQPQSVLCVPLLSQGKLVAITYLEHPTTKGLFTSNRRTIIEFLCAQAAVALQNAQLYRQAQTALTDLQHAQLQLVQSEKMSALGNLVAGVAHEINNPVGFLQGNIQPAQDYVQDLLGLIDLYQEKVPNPDTDIVEEIEAIDLEFIREDLPNLIGSMNTGVDRIRNISNSLRTFSRKDQEHKTVFNLHDGIESTLLILKHRTKANEQRPAVQILKNYGDLPEVQCFPGQLNQVFMNILANAIDAFDEANQGKTYDEIEASPNQIAIATSVIDEQVQIKIQDNGCGMKPETVERIFEQGFTTKGVGKGTGLGMAIAHQIITEKHGGTITCTSQLGTGTTFIIVLPAS
ncbi:MAG: trifunctional serine/threonine-protein kinase/ATP-binding protein/sensor histidine kinase [Spirulinaceae cyanobacterium]